MAKVPRRMGLQIVGYGVLVLAIIAAGAFIITKNYKASHNPTAAFWDAMTATMTTPGITCTVHDVTAGRDSTQAVSLDLVSKTNASSKTSISQSGTVVNTEGIATANADYVRYTKLGTAKKAANGKPVDFSRITNVWAKQSRDPTAASLFDQTALGGCVVPLASLSSGDAKLLIDDMSRNNVFGVKPVAATSTSLQGTRVFRYNAVITPDKYVPFMQRFAKVYGLASLNNLSANTFNGRPAQKAVFLVSASGHRLMQITFDGQQRTFDFSDYGQRPVIAIPKNPITFSELQKRLQQTP